MLKPPKKRVVNIRATAARLLSVRKHGPMEQLKEHLIRAHACLNNMHESASVTHYKLARKELIDMRDTLDRILTVDMPRDLYDVRFSKLQERRLYEYMLAHPDKFPDVHKRVQSKREEEGHQG